MVKAEKGGLLNGSGHAMGRGRVSTQLIFSHLWDSDMSYRFKQTKELGQGTEVCINSLVGLLTVGASNLGQAGGLIQF
jgi:hypothetical protein